MKKVSTTILLALTLVACHSQKTTKPSMARASSTEVRWVQDMLDPAKANAIGDGIEAYLLKAYPLYKQNEVVHYVKGVGAHVAMFSARPHHPKYEFFVLDTLEWINIGLPGGHIFISRGLLKEVQTEDELAGLLGSSIAHVTHQHLLTWMSEDQQLDLQQPNEISDAAWAATYDKLRVYWFEAEAMDQADQSGIVYAMHFGYDPAGLQNILTRLYDQLQNKPDLQEKGGLGINALAHRTSIGTIHLEQAKAHQDVFKSRDGRFESIQEYL